MKIVRLVGVVAFILGLLTLIFVGIPWYIFHDPLLPGWLKAALYCVVGGILAVLWSVADEHWKTGMSAEEARSDPDEARPQIMLQNTDAVPGREVTEVLGLVKGHTIFAVSLGKDLQALMRLIPGGELPEYTEMIREAREIATDRMVLEAQQVGADAIVNVRFVTTTIVTGAAELLVYGTAVKLKDPAA